MHRNAVMQVPSFNHAGNNFFQLPLDSQQFHDARTRAIVFVDGSCELMLLIGTVQTDKITTGTRT